MLLLLTHGRHREFGKGGLWGVVSAWRRLSHWLGLGSSRPRLCAAPRATQSKRC